MKGTGVAVLFNGGLGFGHLHEGKYALLHPCSAGNGEDPRTGRSCSVAYSKSLVIFSPTMVPMEPIMKLGSITKDLGLLTVYVPASADNALFFAALTAAVLSFLLIVTSGKIKDIAAGKLGHSS